MFGDEPPLTPAELIYQRMLAGDPVEAAEQARAFLKEKPLTIYYDEILLEGLRLAQADAERGLLSEDRMQRIRDAVAEIVDDLTTHTDKKKLEHMTDGQTEESPLAQLEIAEAKVERTQLPERWRNGSLSCAFRVQVCSTKPWPQSFHTWSNDEELERVLKRSRPCR